MGFVLKIQFTDVVRDNTLKNTYINGKVSGFQFDVKLGYYRGLYLSCVETLTLAVDEELIKEEDISFCLNGKEFGIAELPFLVSEFWLLNEVAQIKVRKTGGLQEGNHDMDFQLMLRSPYLPAPGSKEPHTYVPIDSCQRKMLALCV